MEHLISSALISEIEEALSQVSEIRAARIVTSSAGTIDEIHVLALPSKAPKQLVRDIESTLMAAFGIAVDHKKISIAQLGQDSLPDRAEAPESKTARAQIKSINAEVSGPFVNIVVTLEIEGALYFGKVSGPASRTGHDRLVAEATLDSISQYIGGAVTFALEDVEIIRLGRERIAVSCVVMVTGLGEQAFAGSALVRQNDKDSIVRATLDAINRRLGFLTTS